MIRVGIELPTSTIAVLRLTNCAMTTQHICFLKITAALIYQSFFLHIEKLAKVWLGFWTRNFFDRSQLVKELVAFELFSIALHKISHVFVKSHRSSWRLVFTRTARFHSTCSILCSCKSRTILVDSFFDSFWPVKEITRSKSSYHCHNFLKINTFLHFSLVLKLQSNFFTRFSIWKKNFWPATNQILNCLSFILNYFHFFWMQYPAKAIQNPAKEVQYPAKVQISKFFDIRPCAQ